MTDLSTDIEKPSEKGILSETNGDDSSSAPLEYSKAPDGGRQAWLVAAGACCVFFAGLGFANSTGVFMEYYLKHQLRDETADKVAWIGSLSSFIQFGSGVVGGPMFDRYGAWIIRPAAVIFLLAVMMTSLCHEYWHFMLAQGVLLGIGMGGLMFPAMAAVSQFFDKKRAAALGLAVAGSSVGGVVFPIVLSKMLNNSTLGFGWSVRIIGFIMMPLLAFSCITIKSRLPPKASTVFVGAAFRQVNYSLLVSSMFLMFLGIFTPLFYIPTYAVSRGTSPTLASYLLAIINGASIFGRIIPGILADKLGPTNVLGVAGIVTGIIVCCMSQPESTAELVVYSVFVGFTSGTIISGASAALATTAKDPRDLGTYMGMGMALASIAVLIGPPVNGKLLDNYGFLEAGLFSGIASVVGGSIAIASKAATPKGLMGRT